MTDFDKDDLLAAWSADLEAEVVEELSTETIAATAQSAAAATAVTTAAAGAATGAAGAGGAAAAGTGAGLTLAKAAGAIALATAVGGGAAAVTGNLPDPIQDFVADVADRVGIDLPRSTDDVLEELPDVVPDIDLTPSSLPEAPAVTVPSTVLDPETPVVPDPPDATVPTIGDEATIPPVENVVEHTSDAVVEGVEEELGDTLDAVP